MKKIYWGLFFIILSVSLNAQNINDFDVQGNDDSTITILSYRGALKSIVIPDKIFNMPVSRLKEGAFRGKGLTSVTIPETLEYIGNYAFENNQLTNVTIPGNVSRIGNFAFSNNRLTSITIPNSVTVIGNNAFERNAPTNIILGNSIKYIGDNAFSHHRASAIVIPENVVFIGGGAFRPNSPNSLTNITIGKYVMFGTNDGGAFTNNATFDMIYQSNNERAGKYTFANNSWSYTSSSLAGGNSSVTEKIIVLEIVYKVGDIGPAGGIIFYDKENNSDGWRYLEAAPVATEQTLPWGNQRVGGTRTTVGSGKQNTEVIVAYLNNRRENGYAAQYCALLEYGGYKDWFLPSKDELNLMYMNMKQKGLGNFRGDWYWSSSQETDLPWVQTFSYQAGKQWNSGYYYANDIWVRAIRAF